jgi:DNA-binding NtrC family response regulator
VDDIPLLIARFLQGRVHRHDGKPFVFTREAMEACCSYGWPGEVTELRQAMERACAAAGDSNIQVSDLPSSIQCIAAGADACRGDGPDRAALSSLPESVAISSCTRGAQMQTFSPASAGEELIPLKQFLRDQELNYLHRTLGQVGGSKERAAEVLGISLATIYRKLSEPTEV